METLPFNPPNRADMKINGWPATIDVWNPTEWDRLRDKPTDVTTTPSGLRILLRIA